MYIHYWLAHKPSFCSLQQCPYTPRHLRVNRIKKAWSESQATSTYRFTGVPWAEPYLALNGTDAASISEDA
ncbi:hypothetical protein AB9K17_23915, partial [Salmonella enterica subsp. enterica serovar Kentucky]